MKGKRQPKAEKKLKLWQQRLAMSNAAYSAEYARMDRRERIYNGDNQLRPLVPGDTRRDGGARKTSHVRNIVFENVETQVSSAIPQPKVTPRRREDEGLAQVLEHFLRNELERLPFAQLNDLAERTVPIQGGVAFLVEWDNRARTHDTVGTQVVRMTRDAIFREYGIWVEEDGESEPQVRGVDGVSTQEDALTRYVGYERNPQGGINRYCWVNDTPLEDLEDYQARRQPVCRQCGRVRPLPGQLVQQPAAPAQPDVEEQLRAQAAGQQLAQTLARETMAGGGGLDSIPVEADLDRAPREYQGGACPWCGCEEFDDQVQEYEQVLLPMVTGKGLDIPGATPDLDEAGNPVLRPTLIPFYKPGVFPIVLQRSVSVYGQLLGNSDVDMIADQQNTINRLEQKIIDRLVYHLDGVAYPRQAEAGVHYVPFDDERVASFYVLEPGELETRIPVIMLRDETLSDTTYTLFFRIVDSEDLQAGDAAYCSAQLRIADCVTQPGRWSIYSFGNYSTVKHEFMIRVTQEPWDDEFFAGLDVNEMNYYLFVLNRELEAENAERVAQGLPTLREDPNDPYSPEITFPAISPGF